MEESGKFKYHSKSPQEWEKHDEEKERKFEESRRARKRSLTLLIINLFVIILIVFGFYLFRKRTSHMNEFTYFLDGLVIQIWMENDELFPAEKVKAKVNVLNSLKRRKNIRIEKFEFKVFDPNGKVIYSFLHPDLVESSIDPYGSVLVFDLSREEDVTPVVPGIYTLVVRMVFNNKEVVLKRNFKVKEYFKVNLYFGKDFYFPGENLDMNVEIFNGSMKEKEILIRNLKIKIKDKEYTLTPIQNEIHLKAGETRTIGFAEKLKAPNTLGRNLAELKLSFKMDGVLKTIQRSTYFQVVNEGKIKNHKNLRITTDSMIYIQKDFPLSFSVFLVNDSNDDSFIIIRKFELSINKDSKEIEKFEWTGEKRAYIAANSKRIVFKTNEWKIIKFNDLGDYTIFINICGESDCIKYQFDIKVISP